MYTPRQSSPSLSGAQSSLDPNVGIRVVIQPSQSSYFAGEQFSCTVTFTNTRSAAPPSQSRFLSTSFNPTHKRATHSVSSAPLARPPTSPGTPKTAQPFLSHQNKVGDEEDKVQRKGLIGKPATTPAGVLEKRRKTFTRSLSVDIKPEDIIKRLVDSDSPHSPSVLLTQSEQASSTSPRVHSPQSREHVVNALPRSHPHARKLSVVSDDVESQPISQPSPFPPPTPNTASASSFHISLDPIKENGINPPTQTVYQPTSQTVSEHISSSDVIQPAPAPQAQGNRMDQRRPPSLGLGLPLAAPGTTYPSTRAKSVGGYPPHTAFSTTFSPPSTELLLYAYAQLTGTLSVDTTFLSSPSEFSGLREALRKKAVMGGGSLDIGSGTGRRPRASSSSFFGFLSSPNTTKDYVSKGSFLNGTDEGDEVLPTLETQPSMLAVDLTLAAGESRSYSYTLDLPANLPPTFKGRGMRISYQLEVGTCRASTPSASASSPGLVRSSFLGSPAVFDDSERRQSRVMRVPIRVYNHVAIGYTPRPYDLLWPVARRRERAAAGRTDEVKDDKSVKKSTNATGSLSSLRSYAQHLLAGEIELELEPPTGETGEGGALSGCREAVEIITRNPKKISYDVNKDGDKVAVLTFVKSAYRLGETVLGVVQLNEDHSRSKVLKLSAILEAHERLPWPGPPLRRMHAEHHCTLVSDMRRVVFALDIPSDASPAFEVGQGEEGHVGGLEWKVRLCLLVSVATGPGSAKGKGRAVEVRGLVRDGPSGEWGTSWRASESLAPMERVRPPPPEPQPQKNLSGWGAIFSSFARGTYHDADEEEEEEDDNGDWVEMAAETVECLVPLRVFAGNTAFRAMDVVFEL